MNTILRIGVLLMLGIVVGWWLGRNSASGPVGTGKGGGERQPLFYQSPMHPWIKSDQPGQCTICGMDLAPVYEQSQSLEGGDVVILPGESPRIAGIATRALRRGPLVRTMSFSGRLEADEQLVSYIAAPVRGRVEKLLVNHVGAEVKAGEELARFFSREWLAALAEYRLAGSDALKVAIGERLRQMGMDRATLEASLQTKGELGVPLRSPRSGTVVARKVYEGQWVDEGEVMLEIADLDTLWFIFEVYERDLPWLKKGQKVRVQTPSQPGKELEAEITLIEPTLDGATRTARVRARLSNPRDPATGERLLLNRLFAQGRVELAAPEVVLLPRSAILHPGGEPRVFVEEAQGSYRLAKVRLGREGDEGVELLDGVKEGARVVTQGGVLLDGQMQLNSGFGEEEKPKGEGLCPVSGEKLGSMGEPYRFEHEGRSVELCCKACLEEFLEEHRKP